MAMRVTPAAFIFNISVPVGQYNIFVNVNDGM